MCIKLFKSVFWLKPTVRWVSRCTKKPHSIHSLSIPTVFNDYVAMLAFLAIGKRLYIVDSIPYILRTYVYYYASYVCMQINLMCCSIVLQAFVRSLRT